MEECIDIKLLNFISASGMNIPKAHMTEWNEIEIMSFEEYINRYQTAQSADWILVIAIFQNTCIYEICEAEILSGGYSLICYDNESIFQDTSSISKAKGQLLCLSKTYFKKDYAASIRRLFVQSPKGFALNLSHNQSTIISEIYKKINREVSSSYLFKKELIGLYLAELIYQLHKILISNTKDLT